MVEPCKNQNSIKLIFLLFLQLSKCIIHWFLYFDWMKTVISLVCEGKSIWRQFNSFASKTRSMNFTYRTLLPTNGVQIWCQFVEQYFIATAYVSWYCFSQQMLILDFRIYFRWYFCRNSTFLALSLPINTLHDNAVTNNLA